MAGWNPGNGTERPFQTKIMAEINVTPMVDVMLVLLVIFMVTAPLLVAGVPVQLPKNSAQRISQPNKPVIVTLAADGGLYIRDEQVDAASLIPRLSALRSGEGDAVVYLRADKAIPYGEVMELLGRLSASGYQRISLLSQAQDAAGRPAGRNAPRQGCAMNWVRFGSAGAALGVHIAALGLFVLSAMHEPDLSALQSGSGDDDLTIVATITMQSEESLGLDAASVQRQEASLGGQAAPAGAGGGQEGGGKSRASTRGIAGTCPAGGRKEARKEDRRGETLDPRALQRSSGRAARRDARFRSPPERGAFALQQSGLSGFDEERSCAQRPWRRGASFLS